MLPLWLINITAFVLCIVCNALGGSGAVWGESIGDISDKYNSYITPGGGAFGIWSLIYTLVTFFVIYQAMPQNRESPPVVAIGHLFWISCALNSLWILIFTEGSEVAMYLASIDLASLLVVLLTIYVRAGLWQDDRKSYIEILCIDVTFSIYSGWVTVATILGVTVDLVAAGYDGNGNGDTWAFGMLVVALCIFMYVGITKRDPAYVAVLAWASFFIAQKPDDDLNTKTLRAGAYAVSICAVLVSVALLVKKGMTPPERRRVGGAKAGLEDALGGLGV